MYLKQSTACHELLSNRKYKNKSAKNSNQSSFIFGSTYESRQYDKINVNIQIQWRIKDEYK